MGIPIYIYEKMRRIYNPLLSLAFPLPASFEVKIEEREDTHGLRPFRNGALELSMGTTRQSFGGLLS
jgi:hypothetical protein